MKLLKTSQGNAPIKRALKDPPETPFIDMQLALVSAPGIGQAILGDAENRNLQDWLAPGEQAIAIVGRGLYSFKGSGYVRGGIFDRIVLIQDDVTVRFRDRGHRRMGQIAATDAPEFIERDLFKIPADSGFDPTLPFRIQLLVHREVAAIEKVFTTFELGYRLPPQYQRKVAPTAATEISAPLFMTPFGLPAPSPRHTASASLNPISSWNASWAMLPRADASSMSSSVA